MSDVTIIGLGLMGSALVKTFQQSGYNLTIWNRSASKMKPLVGGRVVGAHDVDQAVLASPVTIICIDHHDATRAILRSNQVAQRLSGRIFVQLSTCLPKEARESESWLSSHQAEYLDGAILCGPNDLGTENGQLLISGKAETYKKVEKLIGGLGEKIEYLGENVAAASTLDLAWLSTRFGRFMGIIHAANLCQSEAVGLDKFTSLFPDDEQIQHHAGTIRDGTFDQNTATLKVWQASLELLRQQARDARINTEFPDHVGSFFDRAIEAGYEEEHVMALYKVMRDTGPPL
ncbi:NAD(P)-dependent oxidoreductase [Pseudohalocynthiibacter aestuariivivens]|jgi:3-hydroxyisobutyrate dehydrogenase-like beta-hydroxyacid dehydrogenase|uniref:NAD(P)-dependent oxidoreductase n=1 Tax=Pseudohalocynthiibacter aestuariivivens TaxID=1591409 RepID=A0ABV5JIR1_9RHOB|nr:MULTISPECIES: NAD(P)-binding domain-containing protein [Pseudohalocynthiibacter]MBS9716586.1 NAD(P)-dependent oxidoreductase [Pseudohalocynthiibacter aestuariivivens]MCK0101668.1 NAD(P)-binding domain-containing protein [Pseudohalocynthiibacter sp. F2068]